MRRDPACSPLYQRQRVTPAPLFPNAMDSNQPCVYAPLYHGQRPTYVFAPCTTDSDQPCIFAPCTKVSGNPYKKRRLPLEIFQRIVIYSSAYYLYAQANCSQGVRSVSAQTFNKKKKKDLKNRRF